MSLSDEFVTTSKIFDRGKTTVPSEVRRALGVSDGDKIAWMRDSSGRFYVENTKKKGSRYPPPR